MSETKKKEQDKPTFSENMTAYFKGVKTEWGKITWPEKRQVAVEVVIVLGVVLFFTAMVFVYDVIFEFMFKFLS